MRHTQHTTPDGGAKEKNALWVIADLHDGALADDREHGVGLGHCRQQELILVERPRGLVTSLLGSRKPRPRAVGVSVGYHNSHKVSLQSIS